MPERSYDLISYEAEIEDRHTFVMFLIALADDLRDKPQEWTRTDLEGYLRAMAGWMAHGLEAFSMNIRGEPPPDPPTWRLFADIFAAARIVDD